MNALVFIILAILTPVLLAGAVGFPTWFAARWWVGFVKLRADYRVAVEWVTFTPVDHSLGGQLLPIWMRYVILFKIIDLIQPLLGIIFFGLGSGLGCVRKSLFAYAVLRKHPNVELRLRHVPITEIVIWSALALLCFAFAIFFIVLFFEGR